MENERTGLNQDIYDRIARLKDNISSVVVGAGPVINHMITALIAGGHVLLEDVPGVGKTTLARSLAASLTARFSRIQFTPDTLPGDVTGMSVYNMKTGEFEVRKGPVFANIVLADEINRTSPKTQSALLEVMQERQVTIDGATYPVEEPFMVIATENPMDFSGTFPLPEAQLDRFMMKLSVGYPDNDDTMLLAKRYLNGQLEKELSPVLNEEDVMMLRQKALQVKVADSIIEYTSAIIAGTRINRELRFGASPRAMLDMLAAIRARALTLGRDYCIPEDVVTMARVVIPHRLQITTEAAMNRYDAVSILESVVKGVSIPSSL